MFKHLQFVFICILFNSAICNSKTRNSNFVPFNFEDKESVEWFWNPGGKIHNAPADSYIVCTSVRNWQILTRERNWNQF